MVAKYFRIYKAIVRISAITELEYRFDFLLRTVAEVSWIGVSLTLIEVIFSQVDTVAGYTKYEMFLIYAIARVFKELLSILVLDNLPEFSRYVNDGRLDFMLTKPVSTVFFISVYATRFIRILGNLAAVAIMIYAWNQLPINLTLEKIGLIIIVLSLLFITFFSILLSFFTLSIWFGDIAHGYWAFWELSNLNRLPVESFVGGWKILFVHIVPIALFGAVPVAILLDRFDTINLVYFAASALTWAGIAIFTWRKGMRSYTSAGG